MTFAEDGVADRVARRSHEICGHQVGVLIWTSKPLCVADKNLIRSP